MSTSAGQPYRSQDNGTGNWLAVHLLSAEEVKALFADVVGGLAFLHDKSILHLDLKPGNVLLTWEQGKLIPKAMLSDFGTSQDMLNSRARSGNTGTLEYTSPESLPSPATGLLAQLDSKSDMWSLGMILHKLLFFRLPYQHASDNVDEDSKRDGKATADALERELISAQIQIDYRRRVCVRIPPSSARFSPPAGRFIERPSSSASVVRPGAQCHSVVGPSSSVFSAYWRQVIPGTLVAKFSS
ncbi:hypothetical protein EUX98_g1644 [Antrodiella citrinella]|uniref:mitogen-activated protein kinase kinase n=1 Tax=Antrodiella citrinella TaxID=2447956 RepID=A0A4S4N0Z9_9APHY|nr:hypothetical protein EUX98_g1644 [Antrodiella citrinella]